MTGVLPREADLLNLRITGVPRLDKDDPAAPAVAQSRARLLPTLAMAHAIGSTVVCAWLRSAPHRRSAILVGGLGSQAAGDELAVSFPAGARAAPLRPGAARPALERLPCWTPADLAIDVGEGDAGEHAAPPLEELFARLPERAMGLLVIARPRPAADVQGALDELSSTIARLETQRSGRGYARLALVRAEGELAYFERLGPQGAWELEVWTGAATMDEARAVGALVGACADLVAVPLVLRPNGSVASTTEEGLEWSPRRTVGADCVAALLRPPATEIPGVRIVDVPVFDVTPEVNGPVELGSVWDATRQPSVPLTLPFNSLNRHVFVTGATGSGKSQTVRTLLGSLTAARVPWMVIEPAKSEYARMAGRVAPTPVCVIRPGEHDQVPGSLNPLEPSWIHVGDEVHRFPLQTHLDLVRALFTASFQADEPFPQILAAALTQSYEKQGWDLALSAPVDGASGAEPRWPTLSDVQREALVAVDAIGYGREIRDNVQGFVRVRIDSLRQGTPGRFFEGGHPLDVQSLLDQNVVFEIEDVGDARDQAFFIGTVLIRVFEVLRLKEQHGLLPGGLAHVLVVEEAHRLLHDVEEGTSAGQAVTMFANLLAEVRAYGEGIIVAEQIPAKVIPDVVKNSAVKVMHRLPSADDREFVGATMNLNDDGSELVVSLPPGVAVVHTDGMDRPVLVKVDHSGARSERRAKVRPAPPVGVRSPSCPSSCHTTPCTFAELVVSQRSLRVDRLVLWAEIVTTALLFGEAPHGVGPEVLVAFDGQAPERVRCALGLLADAAVDRRHAAIRQFYDPAGLRRMVVTIMRRQWSEGLVLDRPQGIRWTVATYRWADAVRALKVVPAGPEGDSPHPDTAAWAARGLHLPGPSRAAQKAQLDTLQRRLKLDAGRAFVGSPPVLADLVDRLGDGADRMARLDFALKGAGLPRGWPGLRFKPYLSVEA